MVLILAYALFRRRHLNFRDGTLGLGILNGSLFGLEFAMLFVALDYTSVARVSLFFYTMPFFVATEDWLNKLFNATPGSSDHALLAGIAARRGHGGGS